MCVRLRGRAKLWCTGSARTERTAARAGANTPCATSCETIFRCLCVADCHSSPRLRFLTACTGGAPPASSVSAASSFASHCGAAADAQGPFIANIIFPPVTTPNTCMLPLPPSLLPHFFTLCDAPSPAAGGRHALALIVRNAPRALPFARATMPAVSSPMSPTGQTRPPTPPRHSLPLGVAGVQQARWEEKGLWAGAASGCKARPGCSREEIVHARAVTERGCAPPLPLALRG